VDENWYVFNVTQLLDPPDGHVSQYDDLLDTPEAGAKDQGQEGSRQGSRDQGAEQRQPYQEQGAAQRKPSQEQDSSTAALRQPFQGQGAAQRRPCQEQDATQRQPYFNKDSTACNEHKSKKDALARASSQPKLPISWHQCDVATSPANAADMLIAWQCSVAGHVAVDTKVNTSRLVNETTDAWQHSTYIVGTITDSATDVTDLAASIYRLSGQVDAAYINTDGSSYSRFGPADVEVESRFRIRTGDDTTPDKVSSTHGPPIIVAKMPPVLSSSMNKINYASNLVSVVSAVLMINSMYSHKMTPHRDMSTDVHEMVTVISITVCIIMNSVRVVMNSSFGSTAVRSGRDCACLMTNLAYLTMSFITEFIWATTAHLPYDTKRQRRLDRTGWLRTAYRLLPRSHGNNEYDKQSFPCCQPYNGCG
jgi:hypothetical protein